MLEGYIKLHRKITEWEWYDDSNTLRLFLHILLNANHTPKSWRGIEIKPGQFVTGRFKLAQALKLSEQQIRTSLIKLKSTNEITIKSTSQYSIITIKNWNLYIHLLFLFCSFLNLTFKIISKTNIFSFIYLLFFNSLNCCSSSLIFFI